MLGQDVVRAAGGDAVAFTHADLDITDPSAVRNALEGAEIVVNCAAYTNVDGAEDDPATAHAVNAEGARNVAEAGARVIYVSTDYVFDGSKEGAYLESDPTGPLSVYGRSKLAGEHATLTASPHSLIVRTSWLFGAAGGNFVDTMLRLAKGKNDARGHRPLAGPDELNVVDDQVGCPTFTGHLAEALVSLARGEVRMADGHSAHGVLHVAGSGSCSWFEFARKIFESAGVEVQVNPCTTEEFPRPAPRPANSVLRSERGAPELPSWHEGLEAYLGVRA
jgi:dTDP-4-dehydrorhamnose reductase